MAVKIRLRRMGSRNAAFYRVIVQDARRAPTGRFIETLGWYDPMQEGVNFSLNLERTDYWLNNGAQPSETAASLIKKARTLPKAEAASGSVGKDVVSVETVEAEAVKEEVAEEVSEEKAETKDEVVIEETPATEETTEETKEDA